MIRRTSGTVMIFYVFEFHSKDDPLNRTEGHPPMDPDIHHPLRDLRIQTAATATVVNWSGFQRGEMNKSCGMSRSCSYWRGDDMERAQLPARGQSSSAMPTRLTNESGESLVHSCPRPAYPLGLPRY
jgi:hypothetical protein